MDTNDSNVRYTTTARLLHWIIAGMVVVQFVLANLAENAEQSGLKLRVLALLANHKSVGITIFALIIVRLLWRQFNKPPPIPATVAHWQLIASRISHWSLYLLLFTMPITGWLMSSASAYSVSWFNLFQLPDLIAPDRDMKETFETIHKTLAKILFVFASIHILAALKHRFIDKDTILQRMLSVPGILLFIAIIIIGVIALGGAGKSHAMPATDTELEAGGDAARDFRPPLWDIDDESSFIRFTGIQAGAKFNGVWQSWRADICFSATNLAASSFDVTIDTAAVDTQDDDRNATLADPEWFDTKNHAEAYYRASRFSRNDDGSFSADGELIIKDHASPVTLQFTLEENADTRLLIGKAVLDRLVLSVGTGEWVDTTWIGQEVVVNVRVEATVSR